MAKPKNEEYRERANTLVMQLNQASANYQTAKSLLGQLDASDAPLQGIGLSLSFDNDVQIPIAMPEDREQVAQLVESAVAFLGNEIVRLWADMATVTAKANEHCAAAAAAAKQPPVAATA